MATPNPTKPAIAFIHGAWHTPTHYTTLLTTLQNAGYTTHTTLLPSTGLDNVRTSTAAATVTAFRTSVLLPLLDAGRDVIVVAHSFGVYIGCAAIAGLGVGEEKRRKGEEGEGEGEGTGGDGGRGRGAVRGFLAYTGFPAREGQCLVDVVPPGHDTEWMDFSEAESKGISTVTDPVRMFYHDCPPEVTAAAIEGMLPQSVISGVTPLPEDGVTSAAFAGRLGNIYCVGDRCIPLEAQKYMVKNTGVEWIERSIEGGHSPHVTRPEELVRLMEDVWKDW